LHVRTIPTYRVYQLYDKSVTSSLYANPSLQLLKYLHCLIYILLRSVAHTQKVGK